MAKKSALLEELTLKSTDFERFRPEIQRDPIHNGARLEVRRKLEALGKHLAESLKEPGLAFASRASLHHPFRFNAYKVQSQWVYLSRAPKERTDLKKILGVELGKDLDQNYVHVLMVLQIQHEGLEIALRIHQDAWWDGENLKRRLKSAVGREEFAEALRQLPGFGLRIGDFKRVRPTDAIGAHDLQEAMGYFKPGEHWLHVAREIPRDDPFVTEPEFLARVENQFRAMVPAYQLIRWTTENNFLFANN